jgi:L-2-amino-thiazoline-4-carboxylic acid hydrolase
MNLLISIQKPFIARAARQAWVGKNRSRNRPDKGRFTVNEVDEILKKAWQATNHLATTLEEATIGSRMNVRFACFSYFALTVLLAREIERQYAIELIVDVAWRVYRKWAILPKLLARLLARDPAQRMKICVNAFLRFPFNAPGYSFERVPFVSGIAFNIVRCPAASCLQARGAADLCIASWCNLDFPLAEIWGGRLERAGTLAGGSSVCDFRFTGLPANQHVLPHSTSTMQLKG